MPAPDVASGPHAATFGGPGAGMSPLAQDLGQSDGDVARQRSTFGKPHRDRDKQAKAVAKQEKRAARAEAAAEAPPAADRPADQAGVLDRLAELHTAFEA